MCLRPCLPHAATAESGRTSPALPRPIVASCWRWRQGVAADRHRLRAARRRDAGQGRANGTFSADCHSPFRLAGISSRPILQRRVVDEPDLMAFSNTPHSRTRDLMPQQPPATPDEIPPLIPRVVDLHRGAGMSRLKLESTTAVVVLLVIDREEAPTQNLRAAPEYSRTLRCLKAGAGTQRV